MCKSDFHESAWNCAELTDISDIFIGKKSQKFSFFRSWVIRGQSRGNTWFSRLLMVIAQIRKNENLRCIWLIDCLSQVYRLALVSARNMLVTYGPNLSSISCQNREKFEPPTARLLDYVAITNLARIKFINMSTCMHNPMSGNCTTWEL